MNCECEQEKYHLEQLMCCVQRNTSRIKIQLDQLICKVSDDAFDIKLLPVSEFLQRCPEVKSSLQEIVSLQKLMQQMIKKCIQSISNSQESESDNSIVPSGVLPYVELPLTQIPLDGIPHAVMLSHINSPSHFYVHLINSETATLDRFHEAMLEKYEDDDEPLKVKELPVGSCWAVRWTDGMWYRARVVANVLTSVKEVYPLCGWQENSWSKKSIDVFLDLCGGFGSVVFAYFQHDNLSGIYSITIKRLDGTIVNKEIVAQGFASSKFFSQETDHHEDLQDPKDVGRTRNPPDEIPEGWNPMSSAFLSPENTVHHNDECAESIFLGMKNTDEARLCKFYCQGKKCYRGEACRWVHERPREGVTVEKEQVIHDYLESYPLPYEGSLLAAIVTSVITPVQFHIYLPYGIKCLQQIVDAKDGSPEEIKMLTSSMQEYYKKFPPQSHSHLPAPGELKVLCELKNGRLDCSRVRVIEVYEGESALQVKVFFIDFGFLEWVNGDQLYPLAVQFIHMAPQAVECWLTGVEIPPGGWQPEAARCLKELTEGYTLVVQIDSIDRDYHRLGVTLHNTDEGEDININEIFLKIIQNESD
ncbi:uncharacterized protein [Panulirus ornatus]|uniref:uncharacterized protein isoform X2 n=1 Tax=Panulirus ornatus TaxID=150431 RepID=UPI003A85710D